MKTFKRFLAVSGVALTLALAGSTALAQGGGGGGYGGGGGGGMGNFDPTQMLQMAVDRMRPTLVVTNDDEWSAIAPRILKVMQLRMQDSMAGMSALAGGFGGGGGGGGAAGRMRGFGGLAGPPDPAEEALQTALTDNAPTAAIKTALANVRESRRKKQAARIQAQSELRDLLTARQEAYMVMIGMLE